MSSIAERFAHLTPLQRAYLTIEQMQERLDALARARKEPIAIVGLGCRFPHSDGPDAFWRTLRDGVDTIRPAPDDRWDQPAVLQTLQALNPDISGSVQAGFLEQIDRFDAEFFGISPREAACMDPQQRLLLEVAYEALEDAGQTLGELSGSHTGVFVGIHSQSSDYFWLQTAGAASVDAYTATGTAHSVVAGRLSYLLDLRGPSVALDSACSSSLVAVHLACQSLRSNECRLALAGGVNIRLSPEFLFATSKMGTASSSGRCRAFDASADGIVFGEGCGVVVLKRLSDALAAGDRIWALIRGTASNQDGRSAGLTAPNGLSQQAVVRQALENAGVAPEAIGLIECHGTGTPLGDPIEIEALKDIFGPPHVDGGACALGSVKTNIGHLEGAAGIAGLIKVVLALHHRAIPPSLHFRQLNPHISLDGTPFYIPTSLQPWPAGARGRCAGVSSFGWSGTNAHVVLEEAPEPAVRQAPASDLELPMLLPLSAGSPAALRAQAQAYRDLLAAPRDDQHVPADQLPRDICYTAAVRRDHHDLRLAAIGRSAKELAEGLERFLKGEAGPDIAWSAAPARRRKLVLVFPGQGSQWIGMGRELLAAEPVFRAALEQCDQAIRQQMGWSLLAELGAEDQNSRLDQIEVVQPVLFAIQVALAALWRSWGIQPDAVVGHSMGEVAAAHVAGALSLDDAVRIIGRRSRLLMRVRGQGAMAMVELSLAEAQAALAGYDDRLAIAASNGPRATVLSGEQAALREVVAALERREVFCRWVKVDVAAHSPQVDPLHAELTQALAGIQPMAAAVPFYSTVGGAAGEARALDAGYWVANLRQPVLFWAAIERLVADDHEIFLELSPHPILLPTIEQGLRHLSREGAALPSLRRELGERAMLLRSLAALYALGQTVNWRSLYPSGSCVRLPAYPWQRQRFWLDQRATTARSFERLAAAGHPLLGAHLEASAQPGLHLWETGLSTAAAPYLRDHRVQGEIVLPAAAYLEMALSAGAAVFEAGAAALERVTFHQVLIVDEAQPRPVQLALSVESPEGASFKIASRSTSGSAWMLHASGTIRRDPGRTETPDRVAIEAIRERCPSAMGGDELYQAMTATGLEYGPAFRGVEQIWRGDGEAIGCVRLPEGLAPATAEYQIFPALLDACLQVMAAAMPGDHGDPYLPVGVARVRLFDRPGARMWSHAHVAASSGAPANALEADLRLLDESGRLVAQIDGLRVQRLDTASRATGREQIVDWLYELRWLPRPLAAPPEGQAPATSQPHGSWLIFADQEALGPALRSRLEQHGETVVRVSPATSYQVEEAGDYRMHPGRPEQFRQLLKDLHAADRPPLRGILYLWGQGAPPTEATTPDALEAAQELTCTGVLHLVQALAHAGWRDAPRLWLVTRGAQAIAAEQGSIAIAQAPLWGLGRTITYEHPELACTLIDLSSQETAGEAGAIVDELWSDTGEGQVALRDGARYVARLAHLEDGSMPPAGAQSAAGPALVRAAEQPFRLEIGTPGVLDNLQLRATSRRHPGRGEVEIEVHAAGLNFVDVLLALGVLPDDAPGANGAGPRLGGECAGRILAIGEGVAGLTEGQEVVALASWSFGRFVTTPSERVVAMPAGLSFAEAATIPIAFLTAAYALSHVARLAEGERVLIHAAAGGVGLAAVQLAQQIGAEVFATAGSPEKREFLRSLGVRYVADSRSLAFADQVMEWTGGQGVDVVLNSLSGDFIDAGFGLLRDHGRFVEIGKRDYYANRKLGLRPFLKNLSFTLVDLLAMSLRRPAYVQSLLQEIVQRFETGALKPIAHRVVPIAQVADAFHQMAQALHIGKIVVSLEDREDVWIAPASGASTERELIFAAEATYLIVGGLGGLGLTVARWMVERGARHLVLLGRGAGSQTTRPALDALTEQGARVVVARADVAQPEQLADVLATIDRSMPPLRGVFHAAGVLDDGALLQLTPERFRTTMAPKIAGAWNLHVLTREHALDYFVLFSSAAGLLGSPGQANYAAGNTFLDALAQHRRAHGLPALSIAWGPWAEVGLAAAQANRGRRLALRGTRSLAPEQGLAILERLLHGRACVVAAMPLNVRQWRQFYPKAAQSPLFELLAGKNGDSSRRDGMASQQRAALLTAAPDARQALLEDHLIEQLALVLRIDRQRIDPRQPLSAIGFDSLMALEFRNRLELSLGLTLPATLVWGHPTIAALAPHLASRMGIALSDPKDSSRPNEHVGAEATKDAAALDRTIAALEELSEDDALQALIDTRKQ